MPESRSSVSPAVASTVTDAADALIAWQKDISDQKYADIEGRPDATKRFNDQKAIVASAMDSSDAYLRAIKDGAGPKLTDEALRAVPRLERRIQPHELANPNWESDNSIHKSLTDQGLRRDFASNPGYWHLVTLRQIAEGQLTDPPSFLLRDKYTGRLPVNRAVLDADRSSTSDDDRKKLDDSIRNLLRHSGGIWHRKKNFLIDAALPAAWWRVESARSATKCELTERQIYEVLRRSWRYWADKAAWSSTRLAAPNAIAAFALAVEAQRSADGDWPDTKTCKEMIDKLMRRTLHLSVTHVSPQDLAALVE